LVTPDGASYLRHGHAPCRFACVPSMNDSLEVEVLYPA